MAAPLTGHQRLLEQVWQICVNQFAQGVVEVILPLNLRDVLGPRGVQTIAERYSAIIGVPAVVFLDQALDAVRMVRPAAYVLTDKSSLATTTPGSIRANVESAETLSTSPSRGSDTEAQAAVVKAGKVPRPPNAFILYRQHHHPLVKRASPHLHNNEISVILGKQWRNESSEVKDHFKTMANLIKEKHTMEHPEYQYQPRKPSEKKRRMTRRKAAALAEAAEQEVLVSSPDVAVDHSGDQGSYVALQAALSNHSSGESNADTTTAEEDFSFDSQIPDEEDDSLAEFVAFENEAETNGWTAMSNGLYTLNMPTDPKVHSDLVQAFNVNYFDPNKYILTNPYPMPTVPFSFHPSDVAAASEAEALSLVDWDFINRQAAENDLAVAKCYRDEADEVGRLRPDWRLDDETISHLI